MWSYIITATSNDPHGTPNYRSIKCLFNSMPRLTKTKHQKSELLSLCQGIHRWPVDSPHKGTETPKMLPFDDVLLFIHVSLVILSPQLVRIKTMCKSRVFNHQSHGGFVWLHHSPYMYKSTRIADKWEHLIQKCAGGIKYDFIKLS